MPVLRMDARQFASYHKRLAQQFKPAVMRGVRAGAARCVTYLVEQTRGAASANPAGKGTGGAVNSGSFLRLWRSFPLPDGALVTNTSPYGPIIEYGRRPGAKMPPLLAIGLWLQRRLGLSAADARSRAFLVARAIKRRGLIGRRIMTSDASRQRQLELIHAEVVHELNKELNRHP